jgi:general stress protein YciG
MAINENIRDEQPGQEGKTQSPDSSQATGEASGELRSDRPVQESRPVERPQGSNENNRSEERRKGARGTAAMDPQTRQEVARKGGLAVSRNKQHMAEIGRKGGQTVSKNRDHMASIGRKGGEASRGRS